MSKNRTEPVYEQVTIADLAEGQTFWPAQPARNSRRGAVVAASILVEPDMATLITDDAGIVYAYDPVTPVFREVTSP